MTEFKVEVFKAAHQRFLTDATSLSDEDLAQFAVVDPRFAERARAKRAGFVEAEDEVTKRLAKKPMTGKDFVDFFRDSIHPVLALHAYRYTQLQSRADALETRVLDLEAQLAAREAVTR